MRSFLELRRHLAGKPLVSSVSQASSGAPKVNFREISVRKTIWDLEFSEHLL